MVGHEKFRLNVVCHDLAVLYWFVTQRYPWSASLPVRALNIIAMALGTLVTLYAIVISFIPEWTIVGIHLHHVRRPVGQRRSSSNGRLPGSRWSEPEYDSG
jgi:hypothetical protein